MKPALFFLLCFFSISSVLSQVITGTIKVAPGIPVQGATVTNQKTKKATLTNKNGEFSIEAEPGDNLLVVYVGYTSLQITTEKDKLTYDLILNKFEGALDEVVVSMSPKSVWVNAKVGYNFEGDPRRRIRRRSQSNN